MFSEQKAYKIKSNGKCCYAADTNSMVEIQPTKRAKDVGKKPTGEDW